MAALYIQLGQLETSAPIAPLAPFGSPVPAAAAARPTWWLLASTDRRNRDAEIEDFIEGFHQPTYRGMRINGVRVATWSSQHGWSGL
jgi:hypothetical protein